MGILNNKIIVVTGGSGLLGRTFIEDIQEEGGIAINADLFNKGANEFYETDITNESSIDKMISNVIKNFGHINGLVNNAYPRTKDWGMDFEAISMNSWRRNVDMQLNSYFYCSQQVLSHMKKHHNGGKVVNIASIYGVVGNDPTLYEGLGMSSAAPYSAIKGGLINFTRYLASLYGKDDININCVSPGGIFDNQNPEFVSRYEKRVPMKRMGKPDDIAPAVSFLLSDRAKYITGQNLIVDGGWTAI